jgi:hypothetical protein
MKRTKEADRDSSDGLRKEYAFDYAKAKPNPYAARLKGRTVPVVLEPDVAAAFPTSKAVNAQLRPVIAVVVPRRSQKRTVPRRRRGGRPRAMPPRSAD